MTETVPRGDIRTEFADLLIISARGSTEPQSGSRLLKPIAEKVMYSYAGKSRYAELEYPASFVRFTNDFPVMLDLGDSPALGVRNLIGLLNDEHSRHSEQIYVLLGWSQGAQIIGDALLPATERIAGHHAGNLNPTVSTRFAAIVLFGNPGFTAGEPFNFGDFDADVSGVSPRRPGALAQYAEVLRDYVARDDIAAQAKPNSTITGHTAYFHNHLPAQAQRFILSRLSKPKNGP